jgi:hypothetical protein
MKNISLTFAFIVFLLGTTSCKKENIIEDATLISEQKQQELQTALIGSWQIIEKGVEVAMHEGHICTDPANMAADKITYIVQWNKTALDEKRNFKPNGGYSQYSESATCQGTYKISKNAVLEVTTNCTNAFARIEELTLTFLTLKEGNTYLKYQKVN